MSLRIILAATMQFLLRFLEMRWVPKLIMDGTKILRCVEHIYFLDSLNFLLSMSKSFELTCKKGYYPHLFNTAKNFDYEGPYNEPKYYGADFLSGDERAQFFERYENKKTKFSVRTKSC
jgi:hypothetical protein